LQVKKIHWISCSKNHLKTISRTWTFTAFITNLTIIIWWINKKPNFNLKTPNSLPINVKNQNKLIPQAAISSKNQIKSAGRSKFFKLSKSKRIYSIIYTLSAKVASVRCGKLSIKKQRINMQWKKCWNLCNFHNNWRVMTKKSVQSVMNERVLLSQINSPFIVNMHFAFQDRDTLYLMLDLM
jgi:hypothetical protein